MSLAENETPRLGHGGACGERYEARSTTSTEQSRTFDATRDRGVGYRVRLLKRGRRDLEEGLGERPACEYGAGQEAEADGEAGAEADGEAGAADGEAERCSLRMGKGSSSYNWHGVQGANDKVPETV